MNSSFFAEKERLTDLKEAYQLSRAVNSVTWVAEVMAVSSADNGAVAVDLATQWHCEF